MKTDAHWHAQLGQCGMLNQNHVSLAIIMNSGHSLENYSCVLSDTRGMCKGLCRNLLHFSSDGEPLRKGSSLVASAAL